MSNVLFLDRYRKTGDGRSPLFISHLDGTARGAARDSSENHGERMARIKGSLERIDKLMGELKGLNND